MARYVDIECSAVTEVIGRRAFKSREDIQDFLDNIPTGDVVEVVRCKDCQHYNKRYHRCNLHSEEPDQYSTGFIFEMQEDDFCSCGERRTNNE